MLTPSLTLTEQVARQIAADIAQGVHPVGAKLPSGRVLAEQYGVSAAVIREVTERLRAQGRIQSRQGSGCTVTSRTGAQGFLLSDSIAASREQLASVYELRMELEGGARRWRAAPRRRRPGRHGRLAGEAGRHLEDPEQGVETTSRSTWPWPRRTHKSLRGPAALPEPATAPGRGRGARQHTASRWAEALPCTRSMWRCSKPSARRMPPPPAMRPWGHLRQAAARCSWRWRRTRRSAPLSRHRPDSFLTRPTFHR